MAQVYDHFSEMAHAVLYDKDETARKNDGNFHFKNSYPTEPYIIVPKNRVTYVMYQRLQRNIANHSAILTNFQQKLQVPITADMQPTGSYWTIHDVLFAISIKKK